MRAFIFSIVLFAGCSDCPSQPPMGDCSSVGPQSCWYGDEYSCECVNGEWICGGGPDIHAPPDLKRGD